MWRVFFVGLSLLACAKSEPNEEKRIPKLAPPPQAAVPSTLRIPVEIEGGDAQVIDGVRLEATPPTFEDKGKRAWRLDGLVGAAASRPGTRFAVTGEKDMTIVMEAPEGPDDEVPVLMANLRGDVVAALVEPSDPFPAYHGQGGRLQRKGDPLPRIAGVTRIRVYRESP
jgi:hypothetical protein